MTVAARQDIDTAAWSGFIDRLNGYVGARLPAAIPSCSKPSGSIVASAARFVAAFVNRA